jgi:protein-S-isoprenylcysteine O-methyltransferase Ste14
MKKILPPTYFFFCLIIAIALHFLLPIKQIINSPYNWLGFLFLIIGGVLNIWADQIFKKSQTTIKPGEKPTTFIKTGPYKFSRNPMYLGVSSLLLGIGFILGSVTSFVGFILFIILIEVIFIPEEEKNLQAQFGEEYEAYKQKVRRWI